MHRIITSFLSIPTKTPTRKLLLLHTIPDSNNCNTTIVTELCNSLRKGCNWNTMNTKFNSLPLTDLIIEKVLIQLKEPPDAKRALAFFHWSAQFNNAKHGLWPYCITVHILVRAKMFVDARALLESVVKKTQVVVVGSSSSNSLAVVKSLVDSYELATSNPTVFDLLVQVYAKLRMFDTALMVCYCLEEHGFCLKVKSYNILIHMVEKSDQNELVWKVYEHMIQRRTYPNGETVKFMVSGLCKEGKLQVFVDMLDRIHGKRCSSPMVIVNASLIFRIIEEGRVDEGVVLLKRMLQKSMILDTIAFSLIVYGKVKLGNLDSAWDVYEEMLKRGFQANPFVHTSFIGAYCRGEKVEEAIRLMQEMEEMGLKPYDETFNHLIEGCAKVGRLDDSLRFCETMVERGLVPSRLAFNDMAGRLSGTQDVKRANALLTPLLDTGFLPNEITYSHLIAAYGKEGEVEEILKLYHEMEYRSLSPGLLAFTTLIKSLCCHGKLREAEKYLEIMKDRSLAPSVCINEILIACNFEKGDKSRALQLYNEMVSYGLAPSCSYFKVPNVENLKG